MTDALNKYCKDCKGVKHISQFPRNTRNKDGFHTYCFEHHRKRNRESYRRKKERGELRKVESVDSNVKPKEIGNDGPTKRVESIGNAGRGDEASYGVDSNPAKH